MFITKINLAILKKEKKIVTKLEKLKIWFCKVKLSCASFGQEYRVPSED